MKINLFCLPYAGGSKYSFREFLSYPASNFHLIPIELPGRGARFSENLLTNVEDMVEDIFAQIRDHIDKPYAVYGHSMGSLLGYLLTKKIQSERRMLPLHLFVSGRGGPIVEYNESTSSLPQPAFIEKLREIGGSSEEILKDSKLMEFFEPILRSDFKCVENYIYKKTDPLYVSITCMIGKSEKTTYEEALKWNLETSKDFKVLQYDGNHFFIYEHIKSILNTIEITLIKEEKMY